MIHARTTSDSGDRRVDTTTRIVRRVRIAAAMLSLVGAVASAAERSAATSASPATLPTTTPSTGLLMEVYKLQVRPKRLRNVLPGVPPAVLKVVPAASVEGTSDLGGIHGNLQAEWTGELNAPAAGEYAFSLDSDDGSDLSIDGRVVLADQWAGRSRLSEATVTLAAGWRSIRVRFYQSDGGFNLRLRWRPPGANDFVPIPADRLRTPADVLATAIARQRTANDDAPEHVHRSVFRTRGFFELPEPDGDLLVHVLEGPTRFSTSARKDFAEVRSATTFDKLPYWHQTKVLAGFLRGWYGGQTERGPVLSRAACTIAPPEPCEYDGWNGVKREGFRHMATIEGQAYTIYTPAADSSERESVSAGLAGLPGALRSLLRTVRVEPYGTASEFNGGGGEIWVRRQGPTDREMIDNVFAHEIGHVLMDRADCRNAWAAAMERDTLSTSQHGRSNSAEDFAEFTSIYLSTNGDAAQLASLEAMVPGRIAVLRDALAKVNFAWPPQ